MPLSSTILKYVYGLSEPRGGDLDVLIIVVFPGGNIY